METKPLLLSQKVLTSVFYDRIPESTKVKTVALNILHTFYCTLFFVPVFTFNMVLLLRLSS